MNQYARSTDYLKSRSPCPAATLEGLEDNHIPADAAQLFEFPD
jgi:hypothetical protein